MNHYTIRVGTAGWPLAKETAELFPGSGTHLERYARRFNAVEINSSFYRSHRLSTYERWAASVSNSFRFSVKLPKQMTHVDRLVGFGPKLDQFLTETSGLGDKLGPILVQLPPSLAWNETTSRHFFSEFRARHSGSIVCEPRHKTWFTDEAEGLLREHKIGRVAADPAVMPQAASPGGNLEEAYYRWHGSPRMYYSAYDDQALDGLKSTLEAVAQTARSIWCIFDNTAENAAIQNAISLVQQLNVI